MDLFQSFRSRNYLWLWLVVVLTNTGSWTFTLAVTWQVYDLTHSSFWSGAMMFASLMPNVIGAPLAGVLADRFDRRRLVFVSILVILGVLTALIAFTRVHALSAIGMFVLTLMFGTASSAMSVTVSTVLPSLVPEEDLYNAYSLQSLGQSGTEFIGPVLASPLVAAFGVNAAYIFGWLLYGGALAFLFLLQTPTLIQRENKVVSKHRFLHSLSDGLHYIRRSPTIFTLISLVGFHCALTMSYMGMLPVFVKHELIASPGFYGVLMSMVGLGSILGTLFLAGVRDRKRRGQLFWASAILSGLSLSMLGLSHAPAVAIGSMVLIGSSQTLFMTIVIAVIQEVTEEQVRGRVTSVYYVLAGGLMSVVNWGFGALSMVIPAHVIMIASGSMFAVVVGVYGISSHSFRQVGHGLAA